MINNTANTYINGCTSFFLPATIFNSGYVINPSAIPVAILEVNGIDKMIINVGNASSKRDQFTLDNPDIIKLPTIMSAGAVIADNAEIDSIIGEKNSVNINSTATTSVVSPVRPPT